MYKKTTLVTIVAATLISSPASAETDLEQAIVVTATRTAQTVDEALASVTVIDREQIEQSQAHSLEELLKSTAGVTFSNNGGLGKQTSLFMRGTNSNHTLVMVDGIRISTATTGTSSIQFISLSQVERIEIVRGPQSSLYGSDAIGGIIQIFTRQGIVGNHLQATAGIGSYNTQEYSLSFSGKEDAFHYSAAISRLSSDGFDSREATTGFFGVDEPDDDGYKNDAFSVQFGKEFKNNASLSAYLQQNSGITEFDAFIENSTEFKQATQGVRAKLMPNEYWDMSIHLATSRDENDNLSDSGLSSYFYTKRRIASWQNDHSIGENSLLTLGLDHQAEKIESTTVYDKTERNYSGIFSQYQASFSQGQISLGLREDNHSDFGKQHTGQINLGLDFSSSTKMTINYGTAYKAPTFNDLHWPLLGNADLEAEKSKSFELGLQSQKSWGHWSIRSYRNNIRNLIDWQETSPFFWQPVNVNSALIKGLEIQTTTSIASFTVNGNINFIEPVDQLTNKLLPRRSKRNASISIDKQVGMLLAGISVNGYSKRYDDVYNNTKLGGYGLVDLRAEVALSTNLTFKAKLSNLLDKEYQTANTYNTAGRELFISLSYSN